MDQVRLVWRAERHDPPLLRLLQAPAVTGRVNLMSPWARQAVSPDQARHLTTLVPDDHVLHVVGRFGRLTAWLTGAGSGRIAEHRARDAHDIEVRLRSLDTCYVCGKREEDRLVDVEGAVRGICSPCFERGQDELPRGDADDEC